MLNKFPKKEFRGLYKFALQRLIVDTKKFFKIVNYKIEENPTYDKKTTLVLNKIYKDLKIKNYNARWNTFEEREKNYIKIKKIINKHSNYIKYEKDIKLHNFDLKINGYKKIQNSLTESACKKIINKLKKKKVYNAHHVLFSTTKKKDFNQVKNKYVNASYEYNDIFAIPELTKAIVDENKILEVKNYFGCIPTVNTILLTWTFDKYNHDYGTQIFHRDCDDYRQCNMITLLTETKQNNGGHELYLRTHDKKNVDKSFRKINKENNYKKKQPINFFNMPIGNITGYGNNDIYKIFFSEQKKELYGKAGSSFLTDAYALHRGVRPRKKARLMLWVSYGLLSEASNSSRNFLGKHKGVVINKTILKRISYKKISHVVKSTDLIRYAFRNIIDFSNAN